MVVSGEVTEVATDAAGCGWVTLALRLTVGGEDKTVCGARRPAGRRRRQPLDPLRSAVDPLTAASTTHRQRGR
ncbi:hypothetical protein Drose_19175 [Dactylosporangium roseum]|uniref:Uncharacterized protein n=1 Tax=Dactylosporangium roseum TaxID=47989 RepID=A0ABY5YUN4_9ACTN|nr:hypothetical protein [Dactylosporangium roseum]UWZ33445.1 hypothetical protein Drose_19175 [Dactylosporangium roseum]